MIKLINFIDSISFILKRKLYYKLPQQQGFPVQIVYTQGKAQQQIGIQPQHPLPSDSGIIDTEYTS